MNESGGESWPGKEEEEMGILKSMGIKKGQPANLKDRPF